ncbi:MAG: hypothetical protein ACYS9X_22245 [Planctomycetota bacterium]|jgi:hypothetical protein
MLALSITLGFAVLALLFRPLFGDSEEFFYCLRLVFTPRLLSAFWGEFDEASWAGLKIFIWVGGAVAVGYGMRELLA